MSLLDGKEQLLDDGFPLFEAISSAIFIAMLPWLPEDNDTAMLALLGELTVCATYECTDTGQYSLEELSACLHETIDEFLDMAFEIRE